MTIETRWYNLDINEAIDTLQSTHRGLTQEEAKRRFSKYGPNELTEKKKTSVLGLFLDQFKLQKKQVLIQKISEENWMKEQAFCMVPGEWSPVRVEDEGEIIFFYLQEKKESAPSLLDPLALGKEILAADAKRYLAERLLDIAKSKQAIVIPLQKEEI